VIRDALIMGRVFFLVMIREMGERERERERERNVICFEM
jgi:hypothetical protein